MAPHRCHVTHDIDEALYLSDRLALMTDGPAAHVGEVVSIPLTREAATVPL